MAVINFENMFQAFSDNNEKTWKFDRNASLGASEAFGCIRKAYYKKFGYEPDDDHEQDWGAAKRGDLIENFFAVPATEAIMPEGASLIYAGSDQETLKKGRLSATPDGLMTGLARDALVQLGIPDIISDCVVVEYKSFDPRANIKEAKEIHKGQTQVQMGLMHELTGYKPEYAVLIYFNASWLSDIRLFVVKRDPKLYKVAVERSKQVFGCEDPTNLLPEGKLSGDCNLCEFTEECAITQGEATPRTKRKVEDPVVLETFERLAREQKIQAAIESKAKSAKNALNMDISLLLREQDTKGVGDLKKEGWSISQSWCKGKKSLDTLALVQDLEELGKDIAEYQKEGNGYTRLVVKVDGASDDDEE